MSFYAGTLFFSAGLYVSLTRVFSLRPSNKIKLQHLFQLFYFNILI